VDELLGKGAKIDGPTLEEKYPEFEGPPLQIAIATRNEMLAKFLISKGADVSLRFCEQVLIYDHDKRHVALEVRAGITALQVAVKHGIESIGELLIDMGADIEYSGDWYNPLTITALYGQVKFVEMLVRRNANVESSDTSLVTPLIACVGRLDEHVDVAKILIKNGADVNADHGHGTPLQHAISWGRKEMAEVLIDNGAVVNHRGMFAHHRWSKTPLGIAIAQWREDLCALLLSRGADPNYVERAVDGRTLFMDACQESSYGITAMLLEAGADINAQATDGSSPLKIAVSSGNTRLCQLLMERGAVPNESIMCNALLRWDFEIIQALLAHGADFPEDDPHKGVLHPGTRDIIRSLLMEPRAYVTAPREGNLVMG
jgi:ankyrin repeat protein